MIFIRSVFHFKNVNNLLKTFHLMNKMNLSTNSRIKTIEFKTCGQLYEELKKNNKLYRNSPSDGLPVNVEYVDTFTDSHNSGSDVKTIVAIHGNPGNHQHFKDICDYFGTNGSKIRVIVPNMPDFRITRKTMAFWHSNEERAQFIRDFLKAINVSTIDCLISHSAGIRPISLIWSDPRELTVNSIGIFCPQYIPQKFFTIQSRLSIFCRNRFGIALMDLIKPHILVRGRSPMTYESVDEVLYFVLTHSYLQNDEYYQKLNNLNSVKIPTLLVYGLNDKLIPKESYEKMTNRLGADPNDLVIHPEDNSEDNTEKPSESESWIKVLALRGGGHFAFAKFAEEVGRQLSQHCLQSKL